MTFQIAPATYAVSFAETVADQVSAAGVFTTPFSGSVAHGYPKEIDETESLSGFLIALCTGDLREFFSIRKKLVGFDIAEVRAEAERLTTKNSRSFKLLSIVRHPEFFSDWEEIETKHQIVLYAGLAFFSINKSMKEDAFHRVARALRKDCLSRQSVSKPTKLRLRDCHNLICQFMQEYASVSDVNRAVVLNALEEGEKNGCGHLPSQQAMALMKKLARV